MSQVQTQETTKDGTSPTQAKKRGRPAKTIGDIKADQPDESIPVVDNFEPVSRAAQTVTEFRDHLASAKFNSLKIIEVSHPLFKHLFKCQELPSPPYVMYEGIKVYAEGHMEACDKKDARYTQDILFPAG